MCQALFLGPGNKIVTKETKLSVELVLHNKNINSLLHMLQIFLFFTLPFTSVLSLIYGDIFFCYARSLLNPNLRSLSKIFNFNFYI